MEHGVTLYKGINGDGNVTLKNRTLKVGDKCCCVYTCWNGTGFTVNHGIIDEIVDSDKKIYHFTEDDGRYSYLVQDIDEEAEKLKIGKGYAYISWIELDALQTVINTCNRYGIDWRQCRKKII